MLDTLAVTPGRVIIGLWIVWALSWLVAGLWSDKTVKRVGMGRELGYRLVVAAGALALATLGFAFCWWARIHLGRLWSGTITRKADHHVVDTGPYALVRHPIYTGILLAIFATMLAKGSLPGIAAAVLITTGLWMKARLEEAWLRSELGAEAYDEYRQRVPMLVPFGPRGQ
jgi:protein-S-isoprenylcysteine O-methyltransferase Ste14